MNRLGNFLIVAFVVAFGFLGTEAKAQVNVTASLYGDNSGIQAYGTASTQYQFGHLDYFEMYLTGPNAGYGSDYWTEGWVGGSGGGPSSTDHSMTVGFQYDSDYDLSVFACASDDNGSQCSSDTVHFHTPPESAAGDWPGEGMICSVGPCPYITSIDPRPIFYYPGSGSFTVYGGNLQNLAGAWITYPTVYWNIDSSEGVSLSIVSASNDQATISYTVNPSYAGGVCASPGMACHNWELWVIGPNSDQYHLPVFPYRSY